MENWDLLYIAFVDLEGPTDSGSGVRPKKMAEAFRALGLKIKILDGWPNQRAQRKKAVRETLQWLENNTPRACYIEPPTGPLLVGEDRKLIRRLHEKGIPTGLFYRDLFWLFPHKFQGVSAWKVHGIRFLQKRDLALYRQTLQCFFFPSKETAQAANFDVNWQALPPGTEVLEDERQWKPEMERLTTRTVPNLIYVGGIQGDYGLDLLLDSLMFLNMGQVRMNLTLVCRKPEWEAFQKLYPVENLSWLTVHHAQGADLIPLYNAADFAVIPFKKTTYMDFAVPIKLMEYVSQRKPIFTTNCQAVASFVQSNNIGWVMEDNPKSISETMDAVLKNREDALQKKEAIRLARAANTWTRRAEQALKTLDPSHPLFAVRDQPK